MKIKRTHGCLPPALAAGFVISQLAGGTTRMGLTLTLIPSKGKKFKSVIKDKEIARNFVEVFSHLIDQRESLVCTKKPRSRSSGENQLTMNLKLI